jgi:hypothetical protein
VTQCASMVFAEGVSDAGSNLGFNRAIPSNLFFPKTDKPAVEANQTEAATDNLNE